MAVIPSLYRGRARVGAYCCYWNVMLARIIQDRVGANLKSGGLPARENCIKQWIATKITDFLAMTALWFCQQLAQFTLSFVGVGELFYINQKLHQTGNIISGYNCIIILIPKNFFNIIRM